MDSVKKNALIVDDSATARIMLARVLKSMEIESRQAKSGEEALKLLADDHPGLIFLDHLMPGMDGFQTLRALKSNAQTRHIPVIMYTSQGAAKYQEEARLLGASGVITKQVDRNQLYLLVEKAFIQQELEDAPVYEPVVSEPLAEVVGSSLARHPTNPPEPPLLTTEDLPPAREEVAQIVLPRPAPPSYAPPEPRPEPDYRAALEAEASEREERLLQRLRRQRLVLAVLILLSLWGGYRIMALSERVGVLEETAAQSRKVLAEMISIMQESPSSP